MFRIIHCRDYVKTTSTCSIREYALSKLSNAYCIIIHIPIISTNPSGSSCQSNSGLFQTDAFFCACILNFWVLSLWFTTILPNLKWEELIKDPTVPRDLSVFSSMPSTEKMKRLFERHVSKIVSAGIVGSVPLLQIGLYLLAYILYFLYNTCFFCW